MPGCRCEVCTSTDPRNARLRTSSFIEVQGKDLIGSDPALSDSTLFRILVDTGPDLRAQLLRESISEVDAVLYTHTHADHIFGIDDLRGICFSQKRSVLGFASSESVQELKHYFSYIFSPNPSYLGGAPPNVELQSVEPLKPFLASNRCPIAITPIPILHGNLGIFGYRIADFAYLTDCSEIPESSAAALQGLEVLMISGLRPKPHPTHLSLSQAQAQVVKLAPKRAYFIHLSHDVDFERESKAIQASMAMEQSESSIELAYDGLVINC